MLNDTIAAQATPPGTGGVGIIRVSGPAVKQVAQAVLGKLPTARCAEYLPFLGIDNSIIDYGLALYFAAPHSFTGEDVLELQAHGGPIVMDCILKRVLQLNVRLARPGEFSQRAFLNNKIDLIQAEAIADLISSHSEEAARSAMRSLQGEFSCQIKAIVDKLIDLRMYIEAAMDFPEEEIDFLADSHVDERIDDILAQLEKLSVSATQGVMLKEGLKVVIIGRPNVGKSTLLNALAGYESAIVTDVPGTTRDVMREQILIDGLPIHIVDTAGLRETDNVVEQEGIKRAIGEIEKADHVVWLIDCNNKNSLSELQQHYSQIIPSQIAQTVVYNKIDVTQETASYDEASATIWLSAKNHHGLDFLRQHLKKICGWKTTEGNFIARRRHLEALEKARQAIYSGKVQLLQHKAGELLAEDLRMAQQCLGEITGEFSSDDLLGQIFSNFCIGK